MDSGRDLRAGGGAPSKYFYANASTRVQPNLSKVSYSITAVASEDFKESYSDKNFYPKISTLPNVKVNNRNSRDNFSNPEAMTQDFADENRRILYADPNLSRATNSHDPVISSGRLPSQGDISSRGDGLSPPSVPLETQGFMSLLVQKETELREEFYIKLQQAREELARSFEVEYDARYKELVKEVEDERRAIENERAEMRQFKEELEREMVSRENEYLAIIDELRNQKNANGVSVANMNSNRQTLTARFPEQKPSSRSIESKEDETDEIEQMNYCDADIDNIEIKQEKVMSEIASRLISEQMIKLKEEMPSFDNNQHHRKLLSIQKSVPVISNIITESSNIDADPHMKTMPNYMQKSLNDKSINLTKSYSIKSINLQEDKTEKTSSKQSSAVKKPISMAAKKKSSPKSISPVSIGVENLRINNHFDLGTSNARLSEDNLLSQILKPQPMDSPKTLQIKSASQILNERELEDANRSLRVQQLLLTLPSKFLPVSSSTPAESDYLDRLLQEINSLWHETWISQKHRLDLLADLHRLETVSEAIDALRREIEILREFARNLKPVHKAVMNRLSIRRELAELGYQFDSLDRLSYFNSASSALYSRLRKANKDIMAFIHKHPSVEPICVLGVPLAEAVTADFWEEMYLRKLEGRLKALC